MRLIDADILLGYVNKYDRGQPIGKALRAMLEKSPTVDAVPVRHGKWIYGNEFHWYTASCSRCGYKRTTDIKATNWNGWKYCPHCGAKMDEVTYDSD